MLLNEHQSKLLFAEASILTPPGRLIGAGDLDGFHPDFPGPWYCKAQVLVGGRGKAGGVLRADNPDALRAACRSLCGARLKGAAVPFVRVEPAILYVAEYYLSFAVSRSLDGFAFTAGPGGVEVEELAATPGGLLVQKIDPWRGVAAYQTRAAFFHLFTGAQPPDGAWRGFQQHVADLWAAVQRYGLLLAEINPLVWTTDGAWMALDGKVEIDDAVVDLDASLERFYQPEHATAEENRARSAGLSYVALDGWVGLLGNGAGLVMATMDILNLAGLPAANFMDLGGAADSARMSVALDLLFSNAQVKAGFLNLFGGIVSCEAVARTLVQALDGKPPVKPLVLRLAGNGAQAGRALLQDLGMDDIYVVSDMASAMQRLRVLSPAGYPPPKPAPPAPPIAAARSAALLKTAAPSAAAGLGLCASSKVLVQGITGKAARLHTALMLEYGTRIVAGVTPFKGGARVCGVPVYNSVRQAIAAHGEFDASVIFVPGAFAADAILEAAESGVRLIVCITEGIAQAAMLGVREALRGRLSLLIGPNTPGVLVPGQIKLGIMPAEVFQPGPVAVFSRSGTLAYETASRLSASGLGQSLCVGMGGDPFVGASFSDLLDAVVDDGVTRAVVVLGEIGGQAEEDLAAHISKTGFRHPVLAFIAGRTAPAGKRLGHAGAILDADGGVASKLERLQSAGVTLLSDLRSMPALVSAALASGR